MFHKFIQLINSYTYKNNTDFLTLFFDSIIDDDVVNPFKNIEDDTRTRIFNGSSVSKDKAADLSSHINLEKLQNFYEQHINRDDLPKLIDTYNTSFKSKTTVSFAALAKDSYNLLNNLLFSLSNKKRKSPESSLLGTSANSKDFNSTFKRIASNTINVPNNNSVDIFILNNESYDFDINILLSFLETNIQNYVYSKAYNNNYDKNKLPYLGISAIKALIEYCNTNSKSYEAIGEYLIYAFLECVLGSPKIKSKIELTNSANGQCSIAEGIYINTLPGSNNSINHQIVYGSSNINLSLSECINDAFNKIDKILERKNVDLQLYDESMNFVKIDKKSGLTLKELILPSENKSSKSKINDGIGIFLGYSITQPKSPLPFNENIKYKKQQIQQNILDAINIINDQISSRNLNNYSFYIYLLPFENAKRDVSILINKLTLGAVNNNE